MMYVKLKVLVPVALGVTVLAGWIAGCTASAESANRLTVSPHSLSINASLGMTTSGVVNATNGGTRSIDVRRVKVTGDGFSMAGLTFPVTIPAGGSKSLLVKFHATRSGTVQGTLEILAEEQDEPIVVRLSGGASSSTPTVHSITISPSSASLATNGSIRFAASIQGTGDNDSVTWTASTGTITSSGVYTAPLRPGTVTITATSNSDPTKSASATVVVTAKPVAPPSPGPVTSVAVSPTSAAATTNGRIQFEASVQGAGGNTSILWTASSGSITSTGLYTASANPGSATITATSNANPSESASAIVVITAASPSPSVTSLTVSPSTAVSITTGTLPFTATVLGTSSDKTVTWTTSLGNITSSGAYTAPPNPGTAKVTARSNVDPTKFASATVKIVAAPPQPPPTPTPAPPPSPRPASNTIPSTFFGMVWNHNNNRPSVPFGAERIWDVGATWADLEPTKGAFHWGALDLRLAAAAAKGVDVLYTFGKIPRWISSNPGQDCFSGTGCAAPPTDVDSGDASFKAFVTALVNHSLMAGTHIRYYELWNEPNYGNFWSGTPAQLAIMANDAHTIIHALDPNAETVGPSPTGNNPTGWWQEWYAAGGSKHDVISFHGYSHGGIAGDLANLAGVKAQMAANGDNGLPVWITEANWGRANEGIFTDNERVAYLAQQYLLYWNNGIERFYWYSWDNPYYGPLWDSSRGIHPAGTAYGLLYTWMVGSSYADQPCSQTADATWTCTLTLSNGSDAEIVWNPSTSKSFSTTFHTYRTLDNDLVNTVAGGAIVIGNQPILLN